MVKKIDTSKGMLGILRAVEAPVCAETDLPPSMVKFLKQMCKVNQTVRGYYQGRSFTYNPKTKKFKWFKEKGESNVPCTDSNPAKHVRPTSDSSKAAKKLGTRTRKSLSTRSRKS